MKVMLDEGVPRALVGALRTRNIDTDPFEPAWIGLKNGVLIRRVEDAGYSVLVTNDKNMAFQQSLKGAGIAVVALPSNRRTLVLSRTDDIADTIRRAKPGQHVLMNLDGTRAVRNLLDGATVISDLPPLRTFKD